MVNNKFEVYKLRRELKRSGIEYEFIRPSVNEFGEPEEGVTEQNILGTLKGLYHEQNSHISVTMGDTTQVRTKKVPSILCLYEDIYSIKPMIGDMVHINGKPMRVTGIVNVQEWNQVSDISLEVIDTGI